MQIPIWLTLPEDAHSEEPIPGPKIGAAQRQKWAKLKAKKVRYHRE